ncbi:hypothetical protein QR680_010987 [Steinernema hermaphroditum]|uniref:Nematode cuticle collagen N-terminal domain-containing protein n=1 Tax=Steinernema hermaphroditum TaxID=289476 RepID=A0AA39MCF9_9BILA|nr:hypothetical protein QR680_010987 [Steinernema hermaphroditum]
MSFHRTVVVFGSAASAVAIVASVIVAGILLNDVNQLYYDVVADLDEFKFYANDAWKGIMHYKQRSHGSIDFDSIFTRIRRQGYDQGGYAAPKPKCNCAAQVSGCPPGPPGPPVSDRAANAV